MAEVVAVEVDIRGTKDIFTLQNAIKATNKEIKQLQKDIKATNDPLERIEKQKAFDNLTKDLVKYKAELKTARTAQANVIRDLQAAESGAGSYRELNAELVKARQSFKALSEEERKAKVGKNLVKRITKLDRQLKKLDKSIGNNQRNVGNYKSALEGLNGVFVSLGGNTSFALGNFSKIGSTLRRVISAFKTLKGAIAATGIGALILVLGSFITFLTKTQRGLDLLGQGFAAVTATIDVIIDRISKFGEALGAAFSGDFNKAAKLFKESVSDIGTEIINESKAALQLEKDLQRLEKRRISLILTNKKRQLQIAKLRREAEELSKTDRKAAAERIKQAIEIQKAISDSEVGIAKERARISQEQLDLGESLNSDIEETRRLQAEVLDVEEKRDDAIRGLTRRLNSLTGKQKETNKATRDQVTAYELLQNQVSALTKEIQDQLAKGIVPSQQKTDELRQKTEQLAQVQEDFNRIIGKTKTEVKGYASGSLLDLNKQISDLQRKQEGFVLGSSEYLATQKQIEALEAQRAAGLRILTINSEEYAQAQAQAAKDIAATQEELTLLEATQQQLLQAQSAAEVKAIQEQLSKDLEALNTDRLQAQLQALKDQRLALQIDRDLQLQEAEKDAAKKEQINKEFLDKLNANQLQQLSIEKSLLDQSVSNFSASENKKTQKAQEEAKKRAEATKKGIETGLQAAAQATRIIGDALAIEDQAQLARLEKAEEERAVRIAGLTDEINATSGLQQQFLQQQLDEELKAQEQAAKQREQIKKSQAEKEKAIAIVQAIINTALAVTSALTAGPIAGPILAAIAGAAGAVQIAAISSQQFKDGGMIEGNSHDNGGVPFTVKGKAGFEAEGGEIIFSKRAVNHYGASNLLAMNKEGNAKGRYFANGGLVTPLGSPSIAATTGIGSSSDFAKTLSDISSNTAATTARIANQRVTLNTRDLSQEDEDKQVILNTIS